jgi:putative ABC transport system permease protein
MLDTSQWYGEIRRRLQGLDLPPAREAEIVAEIADHLEQEYSRAIAWGSGEAEAERQALAALNDPALLTQLRSVERTRPAEPNVPGSPAGRNLAADVWQDLRYAFRMFGRNPGFTALAILSLALGIGGNTVMFNTLSAALLKPLPYPEPHRLVRAANTGYYPYGGLVNLQQESRTMDVAAFLPGVECNLTGPAEPWRVTGSAVSANFPAVLGVEAQLGRAFRDGDDRPGKDNMVLLSHALWQDRFGGDPQVVGRVVRLCGVDRRIAGVMPPRFAFPDDSTAFWIPLHIDSREQASYWSGNFTPVIARLRSGATLAQARDEIQILSRRMIALYPYAMGRNFNAQATLVPLQEFMVAGIRTRLILLQCAVGLVLLIACANVANLLLARAVSRRKEMALRTALGAARGRIVRQLLTESLMLSFAGGAAGVALAAWGAAALRPFLTSDSAAWPALSLGWPLLLFAGALSLVTGLAFGLAPAATVFMRDLAGTIKSGGQRSASTASARFRSALIVAEVALAVLLSVGAGLLMRSLWKLSQVNPGFDSTRLLTLHVSPEESLCAQRSACVAFYQELLRRARELPHIADAAAANALPLSSAIPSAPVEVEGHPYRPSEQTAPMFWAGAVSPDYFRVMHIPILAGRGPATGDSDKSTPVIVVSAATAQRWWPGQNPIGKHIRLVTEDSWRTVVGVAADVRQFDLADRAPDFVVGALYMPYSQSVDGNRRLPAAMTLFVATDTDAADAANSIRKLVATLNSNAPVSDVRTMESVVESSTQQSRSMAWLFAAFAGTALLLAAIGAYGVVSWSTAQRTFEIGMRVALGASRRSVFALVLSQSLRLVLTGLALGMAASFALARTLGSFLYATASSDAFTFVGVSAVLLAVAVLAGYVPARRAASVDPLTALRVE